MWIILFFELLINRLIILPQFLFWIVIDIYHYFKDKWYLLFEGWGLHVYIGAFGQGKTSSAVYDTYLLAEKYKQVTILTNIKLRNFPAHTKILELKSPQDILNAPRNTIVLIDEIGTIFNSRDFTKSKESVPKILFQHLCQCRKRRLMIYSTSQDWRFVDKQLRDIVASVRVCTTALSHPFCRMNTVLLYSAKEYDKWYANPMYPLQRYGGYSFIQSDFVRSLYDTEELVENMLKADYIDDEEILRNRGDLETVVSEISKDARKAYKKMQK